MTDSAETATPAPPAKRRFFKKAAWQDAVKPDGEKAKDIFSHSNEFNDIIAEEARQKKQATDEQRKRKVEAERDTKRRRISIERDEPHMPPDRSGSSTRTTRKQSKQRSKTPLSPLPTEPAEESLAARYDSLTKSASSTSSIPKAQSAVIDLGDSDSEPDDPLYKPPKSLTPCVPLFPSKPKPLHEDEAEEVEDPVLAALAAKARANAAQRLHASTPTANGVADRTAPKDAVVQLLISSELDDTSPLIVKIKTSSTIEKPREAWCKKQGFNSEKTKEVFLTWDKKKLFDSTTIIRLGVKVDADGNVSVEGSSDIYTDENLPRIHLEAWTDERFGQWKREKAAEDAVKKKRAAEPEPEPDEAPEPEPVVQEEKIRLVLKAKGLQEFKIQVNKETTIDHLTSAFRRKNQVPKDQPLTLMVDGERLRPMDTIGDTEIEDMDSIDVLFK